MSMIFGEKARFAIEYNLLGNKHNEYGVLGESWGELKVWAEGKDICEYSYDGEVHCYQWNLYYVLDWICDNLEYILGFDPFPLPVTGSNTLELLESSNMFESDHVTEYLWYSASTNWVRRHSWLANDDGTSLSRVYFSRYNDNTEIAWDNSFWNRDIAFTHPKGVYTLPILEFKDIMANFLCSIIKELDVRCGGGAQILGWKRKMRIISEKDLME